MKHVCCQYMAANKTNICHIPVKKLVVTEKYHNDFIIFVINLIKAHPGTF